jgi:hypothetical protein
VNHCPMRTKALVSLTFLGFAALAAASLGGANPYPLKLGVAVQKAYSPVHVHIEKQCRVSLTGNDSYALVNVTTPTGRHSEVAFQFINTAGWFAMWKDGRALRPAKITVVAPLVAKLKSKCANATTKAKPSGSVAFYEETELPQGGLVIDWSKGSTTTIYASKYYAGVVTYFVPSTFGCGKICWQLWVEFSVVGAFNTGGFNITSDHLKRAKRTRAVVKDLWEGNLGINCQSGKSQQSYRVTTLLYGLSSATYSHKRVVLASSKISLICDTP